MSNIQREVIRSAGGQIIGFRDAAEEAGAASQAALDARVTALEESGGAANIFIAARDPLDQQSEAAAISEFILSTGVEFDIGDTVQVGSITLTAAASAGDENQFGIITADPEAQLSELRRAFRDHSNFDGEDWRVSPPDLIPFSTDWFLGFEANEAGATGNSIGVESSRQNGGFGTRIGFFPSATSFTGGLDAQEGDGASGDYWVNLDEGTAFARSGASWSSGLFPGVLLKLTVNAVTEE